MKLFELHSSDGATKDKKEKAEATVQVTAKQQAEATKVRMPDQVAA